VKRDRVVEVFVSSKVSHIHRFNLLNGLADALFTCFGQRGNDEDLDEATILYRTALDLRPIGYPDWLRSLNNLATALFERFKHQGDEKDLEDVIDNCFFRKHVTGFAVALDRPILLSNIVIALFTRFEQRGNDRDLDEAIVLHRKVLVLQPVDHSGRSMSLNNIANALFTRFKFGQGNDKDLDGKNWVYGQFLHSSISCKRICLGMSSHFFALLIPRPVTCRLLMK
jgi:hypothetical protein